MERDVTAPGSSSIQLKDGRQFTYQVIPTEIKNMLGAVAAILDEYIITDSEHTIYKLYRTTEGNWYDFPDTNNTGRNAELILLKTAFDTLK